MKKFVAILALALLLLTISEVSGEIVEVKIEGTINEGTYITVDTAFKIAE